MSYQILPNIIFILSILGVLLIVLRHLPEAAAIESSKPEEQSLEKRLAIKGLPIIAISKARAFFKWWAGKIWNFALEAKDLKPHALTGYRLKKIFGSKPALPGIQPASQNTTKPLPVAQEPEPAKDENYYLEQIKRDPKKISHYDSLGKFYVDSENFTDAKDVYAYLVSHEPANADFQARLAYTYFKLANFELASQHYRKSVALDSTQPNRYYNLGLSQESEGKLKEAALSLSRALGLEPKNPKFYISLSGVYLKIGDKKKAKETLIEASKVDPGNQNIKAKIKQIV